MITLTDKTTISLLLVVMRQNYGKAWYSSINGGLVVGIHAPTGEVAYKIPEEYRQYLTGMIQLDTTDNFDRATENDSSDRLLQWSKSL